MGFGWCYREVARTRLANGVDRGQIRAHLRIDLVLFGPPRVRNAQGRGPARGRFPVVRVEVPPPAGGLAGVHQHTGVRPGPAVETLHQRLAAGPAFELLAGRREPPGREHLETPRLNECQSGARGWVDDVDPPDLSQCVGVGVCLDEHRPVTQFSGPVTQSRQHELGLGMVVTLPAQHRPRLHKQNRTVPVVEEVWTQLVGEQPPHPTWVEVVLLVSENTRGFANEDHNL